MTKQRGRIYLTLLALTVICTAIVYVAWPLSADAIQFPNGKDFAFSIVDDTDGATVENTKPVYDLLHELGIPTTKTVWMLPSNRTASASSGGQSMSDVEYRSYVLSLRDKGFEIALHGVREGNSNRDEILVGMEQFREITGAYPSIHINHGANADNVYWGANRLTLWPLKTIFALYEKTMNKGSARFQGEISSSPYFWGDVLKSKIRYVRNFTFQDINTYKRNPSLPYHVESAPYVNAWFSSSDGVHAAKFNELLKKENLDRLEREHGVCIVYTHFGFGFVQNGKLNDTTKARLVDLAGRNGHFVPVGELLQFLEQRQGGKHVVPFRERVVMEVRWVVEKILYGAS